MEELHTPRAVNDIEPWQATAILGDPHDVPGWVMRDVQYALLTNGRPLVDPARFGEYIQTATAMEPPTDPDELLRHNFTVVVQLAACSWQMAHLQAGKLNLPGRRAMRRTYEHEQSVRYVFGRYLAHLFTDPRDRILRVGPSLQDVGKSFCVALIGHGRYQAEYNERTIDHLFGVLPPGILGVDEIEVAKLQVRETFAGQALRRHAEENIPLEEATAPAVAVLRRLRADCPPDYRDRFDLYLLANLFPDIAAHSQRAYFIDAASGEVCPDVTHSDRFNPNGTETLVTLDHVFSEEEAHIGELRLRGVARLAVMRALFPEKECGKVVGPLFPWMYDFEGRAA